MDKFKQKRRLQKTINYLLVSMLCSASLTLEPLLAKYTLFDRELAEALQHAHQAPLTLPQRAWICHLSAAMRHGHLCVYQNADTITPSPETLLETLTPELELPSLLPLLQALQEGASTLQSPFVSLADNINNTETPLVRDGDRWYFRRYWNIETDVIQTTKLLAQTPPNLPCDRIKIQQYLSEALSAGQLEVQQAEAIAQAASQTLCWITGGPGTGKTHTAGQLIRFLYLACPEEVQKRFRLILAAPTGKAATQLETSVLRAVGNLAHFPSVQGQTLHRLLGLGSNMTQAPTRIHADCLLIDEASMIDAQLMAQLLRAISPGTRLLFLGDADQLPAVDVGALFCDLLQVKQGIGSCVRLTKSRRTQCPALLQFARSVQTGDEREMMRLLYNEREEEGQEGLHYIPYRSIQEAQKYIIEHARPFFSPPQEALHDPSRLASYLHQFRLLSPLREGSLGIEALNRLLHQQPNTQQKAGQNAERTYPMLITRNQPDLEIWNGEMGLCLQAEQEYCLFLQEGNVRSIPRMHLAGVTLGYCVSVHKSQGSEWEEVLLVLPEGSERFGRQLLYTAATRAKKRLKVLAREETLRKMVSRNAIRCSGVVARLTN